MPTDATTPPDAPVVFKFTAGGKCVRVCGDICWLTFKIKRRNQKDVRSRVEPTLLCPFHQNVA